jgi:hypothetical protein
LTLNSSGVDARICFSVLLWMINMFLELSILCTRVIPFAEGIKRQPY